MAKVLATFRIEESDWNIFKRLTDSKGTNASQEIVRYIKSCIAGSDLTSIDNVNTNNLDERIAIYLDNNLDEKLETSIDKLLDKYLDDYVTLPQLDNRAASIIERMNNAIAQLNNKLGSLSIKESDGLSVSDIANQLAQFDNRLNQIESEFTKAFDSIGSVVHDHDKMLSQPLATKEDLKKLILENTSSQDTPKASKKTEKVESPSEVTETVVEPDHENEAPKASKTVLEKQKIFKEARNNPEIADYIKTEPQFKKDGKIKKTKEFNKSDFEVLEKKFPNWMDSTSG